MESEPTASSWEADTLPTEQSPLAHQYYILIDPSPEDA